MAKHTVADGERLADIAAASGFRRVKTIWDHPPNADLKRRRVNHSILAPGDVVEVPALEPFTKQGNTNTVHAFRVQAPLVSLAIRVQDPDAKPLADRACPVAVGGDVADKKSKRAVQADKKTDGKGAVAPDVTLAVAELELAVAPAGSSPAAPVPPEARFFGKTRRLRPANTIAGQQARLNNLGYFAGFSEKDTDQLAWALEEFQFDHPPLKVNGRSDDEATFNKLAQVHGDLGPKEKIPKS
ncbi:MAG: hypothetical protein ABI647_18565 [Gemmatimonadota bacterium]